MRWHPIVGITCGLALLAASLVAAADPKPADRQKAEALFSRYVELERDFDPAIADLYSDTARFEVRFVYPGGSSEVKTFPAALRKQQIRKVMPLAKRLRDLSFYTEVTYSQEGAFVRIRAKRYAELRKFSSPIQLLVGVAPDGRWLIFEEISEQHQTTGSRGT
jgi:hypothetical protein